MKKNSFVLYMAHWKPISELNDEQLGCLFRAIYTYQAGEEVDYESMDKSVKMAFGFFLNQFEIDEAKYREICSRRSNAGKMGNARRWNSMCEDVESDDETEAVQDAEPAAVESTVEPTVEPPEEAPEVATAEQQPIECEVAEEFDLQSAFGKGAKLHSNGQIDAKQFMDFFNAEMEGRSIPKIVRVNNSRLRALRARAGEYGKEAVMQMVRNAADSDFLNGRNDRSFVASIDWLLKPNNFSKVLEGNYANADKFISDARFGDIKRAIDTGFALASRGR